MKELQLAGPFAIEWRSLMSDTAWWRQNLTQRPDVIPITKLAGMTECFVHGFIMCCESQGFKIEMASLHVPYFQSSRSGINHLVLIDTYWLIDWPLDWWIISMIFLILTPEENLTVDSWQATSTRETQAHIVIKMINTHTHTHTHTHTLSLSLTHTHTHTHRGTHTHISILTMQS